MKIQNHEHTNRMLSINNEFCYINGDNRILDLENTFRFKKRLLSSKGIDGNNHIRDFVDRVYDELNITSPAWKKTSKLDALDCILSNVMEALKCKKVVSLTLNKNKFRMRKSNNYNHYTYRIIKTALDSLIDAGYVDIKIGYSLRDTTESKLSRIWATDKLIDALEVKSSSIATCTEFMEYTVSTGNIMPFIHSVLTRSAKLVNPIILKGYKKIDEDGRVHTDIIDYDKDTFTIKIREELNTYNNLMQSTTVHIPDEYYIAKYMSDANNMLGYIKVDKLSDTLMITDNIYYSGMVNRDITDIDNYIHRYKYIDGIYNSIGFGTAITKYNLINWDEYQELSPYLHRVFSNGSFESGGRFYGAEYQLYNSEARKALRINGNPVVELDYKALHPTMIYNLHKINYLGDPYDLYDSNPVLRAAVKLMFNIAINAPSKKSAYLAFIDKMKNSKKAKIKLINPELQKHDLTPQKVLSRILQQHPLFLKYLNSGMGLKFQNMDSNIAADILKHFTQKGIPCLCVHDSFIVESQHEFELLNTMQNTYLQHLKGFDCGISKK